MSQYQLPNIISPERINISSKSDLDKFDVDEDELHELALSSTVNDQRLYSLSQPLIEQSVATFSINSFGSFHSNALNPVSCILRPQERVGGLYTSNHSFGMTQDCKLLNHMPSIKALITVVEIFSVVSFFVILILA